MIDVKENNMRLIFRPSQAQYDRFTILMGSGRYRTKSELISAIFNIGLDNLETESSYSPTCAGKR